MTQEQHFQVKIYGIKSTLDADYLYKIIREQLTYLRRKGVLTNEENKIFLDVYSMEQEKTVCDNN